MCKFPVVLFVHSEVFAWNYLTFEEEEEEEEEDLRGIRTTAYLLAPGLLVYEISVISSGQTANEEKKRCVAIIERTVSMTEPTCLRDNGNDPISSTT
jgi:hypothetical protein